MSINKISRFDKAIAIFGIWLLTLMGIVACGVLFVPIINSWRGPDPIPFSIEGWNSSRYDADGNFTYTRYKMVRDLLKHYDFHGWSIPDVEKLLNKPDAEKDEDQKHLMYYDLGNGIEFLILQVDAERRVVDYYLHLD